MSDPAPDNIIDLMPYIEGQKFGWTVDMTRAVLEHGNKQPLEAKLPINPYTGEVSALACIKGPITFPPGMGETTRPVK